MSLLSSPLVTTPDQLHKKGDWYGGVRLPEFRFTTTLGDMNEHDLEIVGRYLKCHSPHADHLARNLTLKPLDCDGLARVWPNNNQTSFHRDTLTINPHATEMAQVQQCLIATMIALVERHCRISSHEAIRLLQGNPGLRKDITAMDKAYAMGVDSQVWLDHLRFQGDQLIRPDFIKTKTEDRWDKKGELYYGIRPWLVEIHDNQVGVRSNGLNPGADPLSQHGSKLLAYLLSIEDQFNVWGCTEQLYGKIGHEQDPLIKALAKTTSATHAQAVIKQAYRRLYDEYHLDQEGFLDISEPDPRYMAQGLPSAAIKSYLKHQISPELAEFWIRQGLVEPNGILRAQAIIDARPNVGPGRAAWAAQHPDHYLEGVSLHRPPSAPPSPKPKPKPPHLHILDRLAAPDDWWQALGPTLLAEPEADELDSAQIAL